MKQYIKEAIGTFLLMLFGCLAIAFCSQQIGFIAVVSVFGLTYIFCSLVICRDSACHFNPVLTMAAYMSKKLSIEESAKYMVSQLIGGVAAAIVVYIFILISPSSYTLLHNFAACIGFGDFSPTKISVWLAIPLEVFLTFVFIVICLYALYKSENKNVGIVIIGITYIVMNAFAINLTGCCLNPIRALCPAITSAFTGQLIPLAMSLLFILTSIVGAALAAKFYKVFFVKNN